MHSMSYHYLIGLTTVSVIVGETCAALWSCLYEKVLPSRLEENDWRDIAADFEELWNFNHCIGAIDGKHVVIEVIMIDFI